jgi:hypothetical protein
MSAGDERGWRGGQRAGDATTPETTVPAEGAMWHGQPRLAEWQGGSGRLSGKTAAALQNAAHGQGLLWQRSRPLGRAPLKPSGSAGFSPTCAALAVAEELCEARIGTWPAHLAGSLVRRS